MLKEIILHNINIHRKEIKNYTIGLGILFGFFSIVATPAYDMGGTYELVYNTSIGIIQVLMLALFMFASPNCIFRFRKTRPEMIQHLMLPASNRDKFAAKMLFSYVGYLLMCLVALIGADIVQAAFHFFLYDNAKSITLALLTEKNLIFIAGQYKDIIYHIAFAVWVHSIYTLGASFFRNHSFIKTSGIMFFLTILYNGFEIGEKIDSLVSDASMSSLTSNPELLLDATYFSLMLLLALIKYTLAYRRFCNATVLI
ncbi:MAG: hypothetical protein MJZ12_06280 [Prevotella sp.]|nr:hypothetical protein [Prevotella sp.]